MDDIEALYLLRQQKDVLQNLAKPVDPKTSSENYQVVQETVLKTMKETRKDIEKVSQYALQIKEQLENVRELVKVCSIQISEKLQHMITNHKFHEHRKDKGKNQRSLTFHGGSYNSSGNQEPVGFSGGSYNSSGNQERSFTDVSSSFGRPHTSVSPKRNDIDLKALKQIQDMQRLAKQQQELMDFILKTEALVLNIENDAAVSESDITEFKKQMNKWCDVLETIEEQETRKKEEKEAEIEAEKKRKQEKVEEERKKKEEEEQKKRQAKEANERRKREREYEKRQKKEAEERIKREQKEAERHIKEEKERKRREIKEAEERKKREIEEAEQ